MKNVHNAILELVVDNFSVDFDDMHDVAKELVDWDEWESCDPITEHEMGGARCTIICALQDNCRGEMTRSVDILVQFDDPGREPIQTVVYEW